MTNPGHVRDRRLGQEPIGLGVLGLGVQGRRMIARLAEHDRIRAVAAWDPDPRSREMAGIPLCASAEEVVRAPDVRCVFIASPPAFHIPQSNVAFDAGKPVFCEKPLSVNAGEAHAAIARIEREDLRAAVNFSLAASPGLEALIAAAREEALGELRSVEIDVRFKAWPRPWQSAAGAWLAERREGGFTREVVSHFVFALQRALGPATVEESRAAWPPGGVGSERRLEAKLRVGRIPVTISGAIEGDAADSNRFALVGSRATIEFTEWLGKRDGQTVSDGGRASYLRQLDQLAAFIEGRPHVLPGFAEALAVQETIEDLLRR